MVSTRESRARQRAIDLANRIPEEERSGTRTVVGGIDVSTPAQIRRRAGISATQRRREQAQIERQRKIALQKAQEQARKIALQKAQEQARAIERQRLSEVRKISLRRASQIRKAKSISAKRSIAIIQAREIRRINAEAISERKKMGFVNGFKPTKKIKIIAQKRLKIKPLKIKPLKIKPKKKKKSLLQKRIEKSQRKQRILIKTQRKIRIPKTLDFPIPIFTGGTGVKTIKLKQVTKGLFSELERRGFSKTRIAGFTRLSDKDIDKLPRLSNKQKTKLKQVARLQQEVIVGGLKEVEEKPEKLLTIALLSALAPGSIKALGGTKKAQQILSKIPAKVKKKGAKAISRFLTTAYLTASGVEVAREPTTKLKAQRVGRKLVGEIIPFELGTRLGVKGLLRQELQNEIKEAVKGMSKTRQQAFKEYMKQAEVFGKFEPKAKNIKLNNIESIKNIKAQKQIRKFLKASKGKVVVGGSVAQTSQVKVGRKLGDMDLYVERGGGSINSQAKKLADQLKKLGIKRVSSIRGQVTIEGKKAIEFHEIDRILTNIEQVTPIWTRARSYIIKTPEGIKVQRIGLQARRKVIASFADPKRLKTGKFRKDLKDFKSISDQIFKNAIRKSRSSFFFKKKKLKQVGKIFKRKIPKAPKKPPKVKKIKIKAKKSKTKTFKKPRKLKKPTKTKKKVKARTTGEKKKVKVVRGKGKKKISKKKLKTRKFKPSQKGVSRRIKIIPSQTPRRRKLKITPSQPPTKRPPRITPTKRPPRKPPRRIPPSQPPTKRPPKRPPVKPPKGPPTKRPPRKPPKKPPIILKFKKKKKPKIKKKKKERFDVFAKATKVGKKAGKLIKVNKNPLTKTQARDLRAFITDTSLSRTALLRKSNKKPGRITIRFPSGYAGRTARKFRTFRIKKGKKVPLKSNTIIELRKHLLDTRQEVQRIGLARRIKQIQIKQLKKPKLTKTQLTNLRLRNLKKGRATRMRNLKIIKRRK